MNSWGMTPKAQAIQVKISKWDCIKLKSFRTTKETINKMKRQSTDWEKTFSNHVSDKKYLKSIKNSYSSIARKQKTYYN